MPELSGRKDWANLLRQVLGRDNTYDVAEVDLTAEHTDFKLGLSGRTFLILVAGDAPWTIKLNDPSHAELKSDWFLAGAGLNGFDITEIYVTNAANPASVTPLVIVVTDYVGGFPV